MSQIHWDFRVVLVLSLNNNGIKPPSGLPPTANERTTGDRASFMGRTVDNIGTNPARFRPRWIRSRLAHVCSRELVALLAPLRAPEFTNFMIA
jgi:hypothetical protein